MIERGIIAGGFILENTDRVLRDSDAWFKLGDRGTTKRTRIDGGLGHWTSGEAGLRDPDGPGVLTEYDDDGKRVYEVLKTRTNPETGKLLKVGIDFVIGACKPDAMWANVWQMSDLVTTATIHVAKRFIFERFFGVEIVNAGRPGELDVRHRMARTVRLLGGERRVLEFYPGQIRSWVWLMNLLADNFQFPKQIPCLPNGQVLHAERRMGINEARRWKGALEHVLVPSTTKLDGGGMLIQALAEAGWNRVPVGPSMRAED